MFVLVMMASLNGVDGWMDGWNLKCTWQHLLSLTICCMYVCVCFHLYNVFIFGADDFYYIESGRHVTMILLFSLLHYVIIMRLSAHTTISNCKVDHCVIICQEISNDHRIWWCKIGKRSIRFRDWIQSFTFLIDESRLM